MSKLHFFHLSLTPFTLCLSVSLFFFSLPFSLSISLSLPFYFSLSLSLLSETGAMLGTGLGIATIALIGDSYVHTFAAFSTFTVLSLGSLSPYFLILLLFCTDFWRFYGKFHLSAAIMCVCAWVSVCLFILHKLPLIFIPRSILLSSYHFLISHKIPFPQLIQSLPIDSH